MAANHVIVIEIEVIVHPYALPMFTSDRQQSFHFYLLPQSDMNEKRSKCKKKKIKHRKKKILCGSNWLCNESAPANTPPYWWPTRLPATRTTRFHLSGHRPHWPHAVTSGRVFEKAPLPHYLALWLWTASFSDRRLFSRQKTAQKAAVLTFTRRELLQRVN